ncbi:MAG TPA: preprotein translocase subunit SecE [Kofleriaceae bacterium]|nr:preprotein translocase subunit SecE [Kofleriaceae bacterium]
MAQENAPNKPVHLMYMIGAAVLFFLAKWTIDWISSYFLGSAPGELVMTSAAMAIALGTAIILYRNDRVHGLANEVAAELKKVTWPTAKEVRAAAIVVIIMSLISALILGAFDFVWSNLTELVYG